ncbi:hypothetical protein Tco_0494831 [Tanacetum coccineum]
MPALGHLRSLHDHYIYLSSISNGETEFRVVSCEHELGFQLKNPISSPLKYYLNLHTPRTSGVGVLRVRVGYKTVALASFWEVSQDQAPVAWSLELYLGLLSGVRPFLWILFSSGAFRPSSVYSFELPLPLPRMSSRSQFSRQRIRHSSRPSSLRPSFYSDYEQLPGDKIAQQAGSLVLLRTHNNSSMAGPSPMGVWAEDICRLCKNIIDLLLVHPAMLYEIGLTTIWKHVGHHLVFKDGDGNVATSMSQFIKFPMSGGVVEHEDERVLAAQQKARATKDKADGKRSAAEGNDTEINSPNKASSPHSEHSLQSQHSAHSDEDTHAHSNGDGLYHDERGEHARRHAFGSTCRVLNSSPGGSARRVFPQRNHGGDKIGLFPL